MLQNSSENTKCSDPQLEKRANTYKKLYQMTVRKVEALQLELEQLQQKYDERGRLCGIDQLLKTEQWQKFKQNYETYLTECENLRTKEETTRLLFQYNKATQLSRREMLQFCRQLRGQKLRQLGVADLDQEIEAAEQQSRRKISYQTGLLLLKLKNFYQFRRKTELAHLEQQLVCLRGEGNIVKERLQDTCRTLSEKEQHIKQLEKVLKDKVAVQQLVQQLKQQNATLKAERQELSRRCLRLSMLHEGYKELAESKTAKPKDKRRM